MTTRDDRFKLATKKFDELNTDDSKNKISEIARLTDIQIHFEEEDDELIYVYATGLANNGDRIHLNDEFFVF